MTYVICTIVQNKLRLFWHRAALCWRPSLSEKVGRTKHGSRNLWFYLGSNKPLTTGERKYIVVSTIQSRPQWIWILSRYEIFLFFFFDRMCLLLLLENYSQGTDFSLHRYVSVISINRKRHWIRFYLEFGKFSTFFSFVLFCFCCKERNICLNYIAIVLFLSFIKVFWRVLLN